MGSHFQTESILMEELQSIKEEHKRYITKSFEVSNDIFPFVTSMDYVKEMMRNVAVQRESIKNAAFSSEELSYSIEDI